MRELSQIAFAAVVGIALAAAAILSVGCATGCGAIGTEPVVRSALDAFAIAVEPTWDATNAACLARQEAIAAEVEAGRLTPDQGDAQIRPIRTRCHALADLFQVIRQTQDEAASFVEAGRLAEAEAELAQLRGRWQALHALGMAPAAPDGGA